MSTFVFILVLTNPRGMAVIPNPYPTIEACETVGRSWEGKGGFGWHHGYACIPAPKTEGAR